jgi:hypothetical protein
MLSSHVSSIATSLVRILSASIRLKDVISAHVKALAVSYCVLPILAAQHLLLMDQRRQKLNCYCTFSDTDLRDRRLHRYISDNFDGLSIRKASPGLRGQGQLCKHCPSRMHGWQLFAYFLLLTERVASVRGQVTWDRDGSEHFSMEIETRITN